VALRGKLALQILALAVVAALLALLIRSVVTRGDRPKAGPAPAIHGPRLDGPGKLSLAAFRGKGVVVNFWASWCEPCKKESKALEATWHKWRNSGLVVLGVGEEDFSGYLKAFAREYKLTYPLLHDTSGKARGAYSLKGYPETFFVDRAGRLVAESIQGPVDQGDNRAKFDAGIRAALRRS
jgi:cytochrome c biogenesis protein CcmG/thiol:disulfide interchange protein DsbE